MNAFARRAMTTVIVGTIIAVSAVGLVQATAGAGPAARVPASTTSGTAVRTGTAPAVQGSPRNTVDPSAGADPALATDDLDALLAVDRTNAAKDGSVVRGALRRLAAWRHLVHATVVVDLETRGGLTTIQLDHGTVSAVSATALTITEAGGRSVSLVLGDTRVRRAGAKAAIGDLRVGDEVFVMSKVDGTAADAYLVVPKR